MYVKASAVVEILGGRLKCAVGEGRGDGKLEGKTNSKKEMSHFPQPQTTQEKKVSK